MKAAAAPDLTAELVTLSALHDSGALSHVEYASAKQRILGGGTGGGASGALQQTNQYVGVASPPVATVFARPVPVAQARVVHGHAVAIPLGLQMQHTGTVNPSALHAPAPMPGADGPVPSSGLTLNLLSLSQLAAAPKGLDVRQSDAGLTFTRKLITAPSTIRGMVRLVALALFAFVCCFLLATIPWLYNTFYDTWDQVSLYSIILFCLIEASAALLFRVTCVNYVYYAAQTARNTVVVTLDAKSAVLSSRIFPLANKGLLWPLGNIFEGVFLFTVTF